MKECIVHSSSCMEEKVPLIYMHRQTSEMIEHIQILVVTSQGYHLNIDGQCGGKLTICPTKRGTYPSDLDKYDTHTHILYVTLVENYHSYWL